MRKHAYLIIAHNNFYVLEKLIRLIDDERNDIYIHIDKKVKDFDFLKYKSICKKSKLLFLKKRYNVRWGHSSLVKAEMCLFENAYIGGEYEYYHLLSCSDLPIRNQDYIHKFFEQNKYEFIEFAPIYDSIYEFRISKYHFNMSNKILKKFEPILELIQYKLKINRIKNSGFKIYKGSEWASLSNEFVKYLLKNKKNILKYTRFSLCADEIYKQTLAMNSKFASKIYPKKDIRLIDWERHEGESPHVFTIDDYDFIMNSECLFVRKFVESRDRDIIDKIYERVLNDAQ